MSDLMEMPEDDGFRTFDVREFVRRIRRAIAQDRRKIAFLLGAGCSVGSGVAAADDCTRGWLKELKYLQTGDESDVDAWAAVNFPGYNPERPAAIYGDVLRRLFHTDGDLREALEAKLAPAEPGFAYATLAQIMTHANYGQNASLALSVNFDDLLADALHVYSQRRPHTLSQESLTASTPLSENTPTVLKLHGDAHLPVIDEATNRSRFREPVRDRLRDMLSEVGLVIMGYGGREECILDMLEGLPKGAPKGGVYWVNKERPAGAFGDWLRRAGAVWVPHSDFEELMFFMRVEFGLGHPKIDRFERVFRKYNAQYRELSTRNGSLLPSTPAADGSSPEPQAIRAPRMRIEDDDIRPGAPQRGRMGGGAPGGFQNGASGAGQRDGQGGGQGDGIGLDGLDVHAARRETDDSRRERLRLSLGAYYKAINDTTREATPRPSAFRRAARDVDELLDEAVIELHGADRPPAAPPPEVIGSSQGRRPSRRDLETLLGNGEGALSDDQEARQNPENSAQFDRNGFDRNGFDRNGLGQSLDQAAGAEAPRRLGEAAGMRRVAAPGAPASGESSSSVPAPGGSASMQGGGEGGEKPATRASDLERVGRILSAGRRLGGGASGDSEESSVLRGLPPEPNRRLPVSRASYGEASFAAALQAAPEEPAIRTRFARFLAIGLGELERAEEQYEIAQQLAPKDVAVLRDYARFALNYQRDPARAESLLKTALRLDLRDAETLRCFAEFLIRAHGDLDEAENCLRLACEMAPETPEVYIDNAHFLWRRRGRVEDAEAQLRRAADLDPPNAKGMVALAHFLALGARKLDAAQQVMERAARVAPSDPEVAFARAVLAEQKGDLDDAEAHYRKAIDSAPGHVDAQIAFAGFLQKHRGDLDEAERVLRAAIEIAPYRSAPSIAYGRFLASARKDWGKAEQMLRDAVAAEPFDAQALAALAEHLAPRAEFAQEVEDLFRDALALSPRASETLVAYGRFLSDHRQNADAAEAQFRAAVEIDPQSAETNDALAEFLHSVRQDAEEAEIFFREALKLAPNRAQTLNRFASFLRATRRDVDEAETFYRRALEANPRDPHSLAHSAQFLLARGRRPEGLKVLTDAFDAAWRMDPAVRPPSLMLELWIYRYAHDSARREESLKAALTQIEAGVRCEGWDLGPTVKAAISEGHPDPDILHDLAAVATEGVDASRLLRRSG